MICVGCGISLQTLEPQSLGFYHPPTIHPPPHTETINKAQLKRLLNKQKELKCKRCHQLTYNPNLLSKLAQLPTRDQIVARIPDHSLVYQITDVFNYLPNKNVFMVVNKADLFTTDQLANLTKDKNVLFVSAKTGLGLFDLIKHINKKRLPNESIYFIGKTNVGKSKLINALLKLAKGEELNSRKLTTSLIPGTTLDFLNLDLKKNFLNLFVKGDNDTASLVDTPGFSDQNDIPFTPTDIKNFKPSKTLKIQGHHKFIPGYSIFIGKFLRLDFLDDETYKENTHILKNYKLSQLSLAFFGSITHPIHLVKTEKSTPYILENSLPTLAPAFQIDLQNHPLLKNTTGLPIKPAPMVATDVVVRGVGWVCLMGGLMRGRVRVWSLGGKGCFERVGGLCLPKWDFKRKGWI